MQRYRGINGAGLFLIIVAFFFINVSSSVWAAPLGLPQSTAKIGYSAGFGFVSVDDPDGDTKNTTAGQPFGIIYTDWFLGDLRYWSEIYYYYAKLDASSNQIGQDVERYGIRASLQKSFRLIESWAPWIGAGLDISQVEYTLRHTKDDEGFRTKDFPDRDEVAVSLLVNAVSEWSLARDWTIAFKLEQSIPLSSDIFEFMVSGAVLYRF